MSTDNDTPFPTTTPLDRMDPKRELTSVDIAALVGELRAYEGAKLDKAYLYGDDLVRLKMRDFDRGRLELLLEVGDRKRAHVAAPENVPDAPGRPPNFAKMLRNRISGADLAAVEQYEFDRIVELTFERGDGTTRLIVELFGDGNVAVCDANYEVIDSLETVRLKSRTVAPGSIYEFPESRVDPLDVEYDALRSLMDDSDTDLVRTLATQVNFGGLYAEELCTRAGVEKTRAISDATESDYRAIHDAIERLAEDLAGAALDPRVYRTDDGPVDATPFPLAEHEDLASDGYDTFNAALDAYFHELERADDDEGGAEDTGPDFEAEIAKHRRIIEQQEGAIEEFEQQAAQERERAELLYANYDLVHEVLSTVREAREDDVAWDDIEATFAEGAERGIDAAEAVVGVDGGAGTVTVAIDDAEIELEAAVGVEKNADRLYTEAKRVEDKKAGAEAAIEDTREDLEAVKQRREEYRERQREGGDEESEDDEDGEDEAVDWLSRASIPTRDPEDWYEQFRWVRTSDDFLVIGGRDADQNEALVKKYLDPGDRFFHTQAHGAPATILKATGPSEPSKEVEFPESTIEQAAQFAVTYSSVWKDGRYAGDVYAVDHDQVTKTPESGEFLAKGGFAIRGDRTYHRDTPVGCAVGVQCDPVTRVIGGPPAAVEPRAETSVRIEPGKFAQGDAAKRIYRLFRERFEDTSFVRKVASPDLIQEFMPPGGSRIAEE